MQKRRKVRVGIEFAAGEGGRGDVPDITLTAQEMELFGFIDVEADHVEPGAGISEQERQAYIAEADDANHGCLRK
jgi:hypothetical protein